MPNNQTQFNIARSGNALGVQHLTFNIKTSLSPELLFLIACCQTDPSDDDINFIQNTLSTIDHRLLTTMAVSHGILPLVYKTIKKLSQESSSLNAQRSTLNAEILTKLKAHYMSISQRNMLMTSELIKIMRLLRENSIEALAFKGPALSQMAYGDITLRQYSDLDILVREEDIYKTAKLIVAQNYEPMDSIAFLKNEAKLHVEKNYEFYGRKNGIKVEIHWRLINSSFLKKFKNYDVFAEYGKVEINKIPIPTLDTKILLLYLCNHGASHMWERLEWIADIDRTVRTFPDMDWGELLKLADALQSRTTLLLGLALAKMFFKTPLPEFLSTAIHQPYIIKLMHNILAFWKSGLIFEDHSSHRKNAAIYRFHLALEDSWTGKINFMLKTLFDYSDRDIMIINLPRHLFFLYYPLRIGRIVYKYSSATFKNIYSKYQHR